MPFFVLGAGFMILETKAITQFALIWGSTWVVASSTIASVLVMAALGAWLASRLSRIRPWVVGVPLLLLLLLAYLLPVGTIGFGSLAAETAFYSVLTFSPVLLAGLLFSGSLKQTDNVAFAYGANLLGAMLGGVAEYLALVTGYRAAARRDRALLPRRDRAVSAGEDDGRGASLEAPREGRVSAPSLGQQHRPRGRAVGGVVVARARGWACGLCAAGA